MSNIIDKIQLSGVTYDIGGQGGSGVSVVEVTQAEYDALPTSAKTDTSKMYVITDAEAGDLTNYYTKTETNTLLGEKADTATTYTKQEVDNAITAATSTKQDTLVSGTNIKTINNTSILGSGNIDIQGGGSSYTAGDGIDITNDVISVTGKVDTTTYNTYTAATDTALASKQTTLTAGTGIDITDNVISATGGGGGGKAIEAGRGISITTGETADTVSFNLPISGGSGTNSIIIGAGETGYVAGGLVHGIGSSSRGVYSNVFGYNCFSNGHYSFLAGGYLNNYREYGAAFGKYNDTTNSPLFSVGNGTADNARHNAFEIRENGDIYFTLNGQDVKLQDILTQLLGS